MGEWAGALAWRFAETEDGGISPIFEPPFPLFHEAFAEAIGPWALVHGEEVLSTYPVDQLIDRLECAFDPPGVEQLLAESSGSELFRLYDFVLARDTIFDIADEKLAVAEVLPTLYAWRQELLNLGASSEPADRPC